VERRLRDRAEIGQLQAAKLAEYASRADVLALEPPRGAVQRPSKRVPTRPLRYPQTSIDASYPVRSVGSTQPEYRRRKLPR
jgi:hypothetical protein